VAVLQRAANGGVEVAGVVEDQSNFVRVYEPGHEDADEMGYVLYPNVDLYQEFSDLMVARRMFEANATVLDAAKAMLNRALDI
jgi:flagellar basal-body rod protein FlgC